MHSIVRMYSVSDSQRLMMATSSQEELGELAAATSTIEDEDDDDDSSLDESDTDVVSHDELAGSKAGLGPSLPSNWVQNNESGERHRRVQQSDSSMDQQSGAAASARPLPLSEVNRRVHEFTCTCKMLYDKIEKLKSRYGEVLIPNDLWKEVQQIKKSMDEKEIMVNVFGEHNCGKSTFLNALLGKYFLPVKRMSCTALTVKIQHSNEVHPVCDDKCKSRPTKKCPKLLELRNTGKAVMTGCDAIYKHLQGLNERFRLQGRSPESPETLEVPNLVLKVHLPILDEGSPFEWTVVLVDNPGFGEDKEYITQLASASMVTSSAYIYLITTEHVGGKAATEFFKTLQERDPAALCDGRLIVGITMVDTLHGDDDAPDSVSEEEVVESLVTSIEKATDTVVGDSLIVPVSAKWSLSDIKLTDWLRSNLDCVRKPRDIVEKAVKVLEERQKIPPVGQDETVEGVIKKMDPRALLEMIESSCGMSIMKARIRDVIGKACIKTWAKKLYSNFMDYRKRISECICKVCDERNMKRESEKETHKKARGLLDDIERLRGELENEMKSESAAVTLDRLEQSYYRDVERSKAPETGKMVTDHLVTKFKTRCEEKFKSGEFLSSEFQTYVKEFLIESRPKLQAVFGECGFNNVDMCIADLNEDTIKRVCQLEDLARKLLGIDRPRSSTSDSDVTESMCVQTESKFSRDFISENVEKRIFQQAATYTPDHDLASQEENSSEALDLTNSNAHSEIEASTDEEISALIESYCNEHRELGPQVTHLRDLTSTGRVPEVSSSWWKALQSVAKDIWDQLKEKAKNFYVSVKKPPETGPSLEVEEQTCGTRSSSVSTPNGGETLEDSPRHHSVDESDNEDAASSPHSPTTITTTVTIETATADVLSDSAGHAQATSSISIPSDHAQGDATKTEDSVSASAESGVVIDNWADEFLLESAINRIQYVMEEECDNYFKEIAPDAIKFFHEKYRMKIKASLTKFDKDFKVALSNKAKEIKKMKERESALKKQITKFKEHEKALFDLEQRLLRVWECLGWSLEGHDTRTAEEIKEAEEAQETEKIKWHELLHL